MSVLSSARVWERSKQAGTDLLMLLAIADFADDDGRAYPSVPTLARKCRTTPRHTNRILAMLRESGELEIRTNEGPKGTNLYRLVFERMTSTSAPLTNTSPRRMGPKPLTPTSAPPDVHVPKPLTPTSDEPSLNHQGTVKEPSGEKARKRATPIPCPDGVDPQTWSDWLQLRKAKRAPVTDTVLRSAADEARKADMTLEAFLRVWCARGSQGLQADWLKTSERGALQRQTATDRRIAIIEGLTGRDRRPRDFTDVDYSDGVADGKLIAR